MKEISSKYIVVIKEKLNWSLTVWVDGDEKIDLSKNRISKVAGKYDICAVNICEVLEICKIQCQQFALITSGIYAIAERVYS